jgi:hypothetical protein
MRLSGIRLQHEAAQASPREVAHTLHRELPLAAPEVWKRVSSLVEADGESRAQRVSVRATFTSGDPTHRPQITFGERSRRRTLAGTRFGIAYSPGPTATPLDSQAAREDRNVLGHRLAGEERASGRA